MKIILQKLLLHFVSGVIVLCIKLGNRMSTTRMSIMWVRKFTDNMLLFVNSIILIILHLILIFVTFSTTRFQVSITNWVFFYLSAWSREITCHKNQYWRGMNNKKNLFPYNKYYRTICCCVRVMRLKSVCITFGPWYHESDRERISWMNYVMCKCWCVWVSDSVAFLLSGACWWWKASSIPQPIDYLNSHQVKFHLWSGVRYPPELRYKCQEIQIK